MILIPLFLLCFFELVSGQPRPGSYPQHTFDQLVDHFPSSSRYAPHTNRTFKQSYFLDTTYYKPGGPVFLYLAGESPIAGGGFALKYGIVQILMSRFNGLGIELENRYYGNSTPFATSSTDDLTYLTTEQTIADNAYFAKNVKLPGVSGNINAPGTPWIVYGGSLPGGQSAFTVKAHGDVFYGGFASSSLLVAQVEYGAWYNPIQRYGPQDCVSSINNIIDKFDGLLRAGNTDAINKFKQIFGLEALTDNRDFAATIAFPLGGPFLYPTGTWQEINWDPDYTSEDFFDFCHNVTDPNPTKTALSNDNALSNYTNGEPWTNLGNYAAYIRRVILPFCPGGDYANTECFGTQNQTYWADTTTTIKRSYLYTTCTEMGYYQASPLPLDGPTLVSRVLRANYTQQWCNWAFPPGKYNHPSTTGPNLSTYNNYSGYNFSADRLAFIDGSADVWRDAGYHSEYAPDRKEVDPLHPEYLINGGGHVWDAYGPMDLNTAGEPQFIREAHYWEIRVVGRWLKDFKSWKP